MDYECRLDYNFLDTRMFKKQTYQFQMPKSYLPDFEHIATTRPPPYDPRALTERKPDAPVRDCATWVSEVLEEVRVVLKNGGIAV